MQGPHAAGQVGAAQGRLQQATHRLGYCFVLQHTFRSGLKYYVALVAISQSSRGPLTMPNTAAALQMAGTRY